MILNDTELKTSQQRIAYFQDLLLQLRVKASAAEFSFVSAGYRAEIEKMQAEVLEYLTRHISEPIQPRESTTAFIKSIEQDFIEKVSAKVRLSANGKERFRVLSPFQFEDGDQLVIVLKKENGRWILTDEAHTYMHLTYEIDEKSLHSGTRQEIIANALSMFGVEDRDGELVLDVSDGDYGNALYDFVQALLKIVDVSYLSKES